MEKNIHRGTLKTVELSFTKYKWYVLSRTLNNEFRWIYRSLANKYTGGKIFRSPLKKVNSSIF